MISIQLFLYNSDHTSESPKLQIPWFDVTIMHIEIAFAYLINLIPSDTKLAADPNVVPAVAYDGDFATYLKETGKAVFTLPKKEGVKISYYIHEIVLYNINYDDYVAGEEEGACAATTEK